MTDPKQMTDEEVAIGLEIYRQLFEWAQATCHGQPLSVCSAVASSMAAVAGHATQWAADAQGCSQDEQAIREMTRPLKESLDMAALGKRPTEAFKQ